VVHHQKVKRFEESGLITPERNFDSNLWWQQLGLHIRPITFAAVWDGELKPKWPASAESVAVDLRLMYSTTPNFGVVALNFLLSRS
jgi:hypothetical protein